MKPWLVLCLTLPLAAAPAKLVLADGGKSTYSICISRDASPSERRGAEELQRFLEDLSGAKLPVVSGPRMNGTLSSFARRRTMVTAC